MSREGGSTTPLGSLFQGSVTLRVTRAQCKLASTQNWSPPGHGVIERAGPLCLGLGTAFPREKLCFSPAERSCVSACGLPWVAQGEGLFQQSKA